MPLVVSCQCGKRYQVADSKAGAIILCPACKAHMQVPTPVPEPDAAVPAVVATLDLSDPDYPAPPVVASTTSSQQPAAPNIFASEYPWYYAATVWLAWIIAATSYVGLLLGAMAYTNHPTEGRSYVNGEFVDPPAVPLSLIGVPFGYAVAATLTACVLTVAVDAARHIRKTS